MARVAGDASIDSVKAFLSRAKSAVSEGDVAAGTGLDAGTAKRALYALMRSHRCSLAVHDDGRLFMTYTAITYGDTDRYGYAHRRYEPTPPVMRPKPPPHDKSFIASVYDFVIGPTRVEPPPRAQEQEVAAFVRQNGGVLTVRDVQTLSGMPRKQAEQFFARFVAEQDGVAEVTEDGALYATFDELLRSKSREHDAPVVHYWDEYEAPFALTGNTPGKNVLIALLAAFNLVGIFSLFFLIPLLRAPVVWWNNKKQHSNNIRRRLYRAIFGTNDESITRNDVVERANRIATTEEKLRIADIEELLGETLRDVGGDQSVTESGDLAADLTHLQIEEQAAEEHALEERKAKVIYQTD